MAKCLVFELSEAVSNDMLNTFGEIKVKLAAGQHFGGYIFQLGTNKAKISVVEGSVTVNTPSGGSMPFTIDNTNYSTALVDFVAGSNGAVLSISPLNSLYVADGILCNVPLSISDLQLKMPTLNRFSSTGTNKTSSQVYGDLAMFKHSYNIQHLACSKNVYGDIKNLGVLPLLSTFTVNEYCNIYGEIINLVETARANGRTTGSMTLTIKTRNATDITFNGGEITKDSYGRTSASLSWTASTITCNGVTITA